MRRILPALLACLALLPLPARAQQEIRLATWNIAWLTLKPAGHPDLPRDIRARTPEDFRLLRGYAERLNADIVAIQEIDGEAAAARVFDPALYTIHLTDETDTQPPASPCAAACG